MDFDYNKKDADKESSQDPAPQENNLQENSLPHDLPQNEWDPSPAPRTAELDDGEYEPPQAGSDEPLFPDGAQPAQSAPHSGIATYEEWQQQQKKSKKAKKKHGRIIFRVVGGVVTACFLLGVGIFAGTWFGASNGNPSSVSESDDIPADSPKLDISQAVRTDDGETDSGLSGEVIYEKVSPSIVSVLASSLQSQGQASGSGVIMSSDGYVITNAHVITDETTAVAADKVEVITADGQQYAAAIVGYDRQTDLAVLKITGGNGFAAAEFGDSNKIKAGEKSYAIGSPGGVELANSITTGSISAISRDITIGDRVMTLIQTDASINPGNSGGALINKNGQVIGITSAKLGVSYYEGLGFAIPIDSAKEIIDQIIAYGHVKGRPAIGVTGYNLSQQAAEYNDVPQGVVVTAVDSRSDAAAKGLQAKDIIIGVNKKEITTMDEINQYKGDAKAGDKMSLTVYRISTGKTFTIEITLSDEADLAGNSSEAQQQQSNSFSQSPGQQDGSYYFQLP